MKRLLIIFILFVPFIVKGQNLETLREMFPTAELHEDGTNYALLTKEGVNEGELFRIYYLNGYSLQTYQIVVALPLSYYLTERVEKNTNYIKLDTNLYYNPKEDRETRLIIDEEYDVFFLSVKDL